jgi:hypothetical protein
VGKIEQLQETVRQLERRLAVAEDTQAIARLKARYARLADARYTGGRPASKQRLAELSREIAALFTEDAVWDGGAALGLCKGREAIAARFAKPTLQFAWHFFVKPEIVVDGDRARGTWDVLAPCTSRKGEALWMCGVEEDEYRRVEGSWLHSRMKLEVIFMAPHARGWAPGSAED